MLLLDLDTPRGKEGIGHPEISKLKKYRNYFYRYLYFTAGCTDRAVSST